MIYYVGEASLIPSTNYSMASVEGCLNYFKNHKSIAVDIETEGLDPREKKILSLQLGDKLNQYFIDVRCVNILKFKDLLESKLCLGHNLKFEYKFLKHNGILLDRMWDTMIAESVLFCGYESYGYSLAVVSKRYLGVDMDKSVRASFSSSTSSKSFTDSQILYGAKDVEHLHEIAEKQHKDAIQKDLLDCMYFEFEVIKPLGDIEYNGMLMDTKGWLDNCIDNVSKLISFELSLDNELVSNDSSYKSPCTVVKHRGKKILVNWQYDLFEPDKGPDRLTRVNWSSPTQVTKILKDVFSIEVLNKENKPCSDSKLLGKVHNKPKLLELLLEYKELAKEISTYGEGFINQYLHKDGKVRTSFWQIKSTGRISSGDKKGGSPNTQNIPQDMRKYFIAPEGYKFITCDYSAQEPRLTAHYTKDKALLDFFIKGDGDIHSMVASRMFSKLSGENIVVDKENTKHNKFPGLNLRQVGKVLNLKLDYGGSAYTVKGDLNCSQEEAQKFIDALEEAFPGKKSYFDNKIKETFKNGYILIDPVIRRKSFIGPDELTLIRKFQYDHANKEERGSYYKLKGGIERKSKNFPIQGSAASMSKQALIWVREFIIEEGLEVELVNAVHDEINLVVKNEDVEYVSKRVSEIMVKAGDKFCSNLPQVVEPIIENFWSK